jgi:hypothetical protein
VDFKFSTDPYKLLGATNKPAPAIRRFKRFAVLLSGIGCVAAVIAFIFKPGLTLLIGWGSHERPEKVTISNAPVFRPASASEIKTIEQAMAAIITVGREDLGLPVERVLPVKLYIHATRASFLRDVYGSEFNPDWVFATAVARAGEIHVNAADLKDIPVGEWVEILAHEYGHVVHSASGFLAESAPWFREGFAEWISVRVLHALGWTNYDAEVQQAAEEFLNIRRTQTVSWRAWLEGPVVSARRHGPHDLPTNYRLALLAVHQMVEGQNPYAAARSLLSKNAEKQFNQEKFDKFLLVRDMRSDSGVRTIFKNFTMGQNASAG